MRPEWYPVAAGLLLAALAQGGVAVERAQDLHDEGVGLHLERRLTEAGALYDEALALEPPRAPSSSEAALVRRLAPMVFTTASEPFALRDAAAILHPTARRIAYHLFWDDDIDFPDDFEPSDHEMVWVGYSEEGVAERVWTYFHGRVLTSSARQDRNAVFVQWGKHGSLPDGWRALRITPEVTELPDGIPMSAEPVPMTDYLHGSFRKLSSAGRRLPHHPMARRLGWPARFTGTSLEFVTFDRSVDLLPLLDRDGSVLVSRFNSGPLSRWIIPYNFRPKLEWPE